jgi:hypothetical protein
VSGGRAGVRGRGDILPVVDFESALRDLGFSVERQARGATHHAARPTPYLTFWVQAYDDGTALFTWEFAIAEYAATRGLQVGSDEHLNTFLYPREDSRGPQDPAWVAGQIDRTEDLLRSLSFLDAAPEAT